jgi:hypothetical protein
MRKVLVDISVWIQFLKGSNQFFSSMLKLIENGEIYTLELIFAELLQGVITNRELKLITDFYAQMRVLDQPGLIFESGDFSRKEGLINTGIGLIDAVSINSANQFGLELWTLDRKILGYLGVQK